MERAEWIAASLMHTTCSDAQNLSFVQGSLALAAATRACGNRGGKEWRQAAALLEEFERLALDPVAGHN